jgi:selenocysteine-specific elongation factor
VQDAAMIVVTAGHIDHGKTALVRALTGTDTDRLPEERARGITIELGFAFRGAGTASALAFVDVPGHEALVRTMLAGATGGEFALLVVAADEGPRPQTVEHLAILDLLGVTRGVVALTKSDRVDDARFAAAEAEVAALLAGTGLEGAPVLACSSVTGAGIGALAAHLAAAAARIEAERDAAADRPAGEGTRHPPGEFRLAVDRAFTLPGVGLVVTGTAHAGEVRAGDRLVLSPAGLEARVRGVHAEGAAAAVGRAGQRCALNLAGPRLSREAAGRGGWALSPELHAPATRLDLHLVLSPGERLPPARGLRVHAHRGAARVPGRLTLLGAREAAAPPDPPPPELPPPGRQGRVVPGRSGRAAPGWLARLSLDVPVGALVGDRVVLRDVSARRTVGGGRVLDPFGPERGAARPERLAALEAGDHADPAAALRGLLAVSGAVALDRFRLGRNLDATAEPALLAACDAVALGREAGGHEAPGRHARGGRAGERDTDGRDASGPAGDGGGRVAVAGVAWRAALAAVPAVMAQRLAAAADSFGLTVEEVAAALPEPLRPLAAAALRALTAEGAVQRFGRLLRLPGHEARLSPEDEAAWEAVAAALRTAGLDPPRVALLAERLAMGEAELRPLLGTLTRLGRLRAISAQYFVLPEVLDGLAARAAAATGEAGLLTVGPFRAATGIARHATMPVLEFFDRVGFTRRVPEGRRVTQRWPG